MGATLCRRDALVEAWRGEREAEHSPELALPPTKEEAAEAEVPALRSERLGAKAAVCPEGDPAETVYAVAMAKRMKRLIIVRRRTEIAEETTNQSPGDEGMEAGPSVSCRSTWHRG